jgi:hypothetical protein
MRVGWQKTMEIELDLDSTVIFNPHHPPILTGK